MGSRLADSSSVIARLVGVGILLEIHPQELRSDSLWPGLEEEGWVSTQDDETFWK